MESLYAIVAGFLGTAVEFVEALTVVLAIGIVRGWKNSLLGAFGALAVLTVIMVAVGVPLVHVMKLDWVRATIGLITLLFGIRWLRKSILRYSGLKALHDEEQAYEEELEKQRKIAASQGKWDQMAIIGAFGITFLEGLEAIFIVITVGINMDSMTFAVTGAVIATLVIGLAGIVVRKPLARIPENTMKFIIGVMLTSFGAFWTGEGIGVSWPQEDLSIVYIAASLLVFSYIMIRYCRMKLREANQLQAGKPTGGVSA